jgi:hypothetical protein
MSNKSRIIHPVCSICDYVIQLSDVSDSIDEGRKVLLITGTAGAGKTALGQLIEDRYDYVFIDGDAIQKRENHFAKKNPGKTVDYQAETINTMMILCALGYDVVVGYIISNCEILEMYVGALGKHSITPVFRILIPERSVCLDRDLARDCWTAGAQWVDKWYEEMRSFLITHPSLCIDSSYETLEETFINHFAKLL